MSNNINEKYKELSLNTIIFALGNLGSKLVLFLLVPLYTNVLSPADYGIADLIQTIASVLVTIFSLMIQDAVLRFGLKKIYNQYDVLKSAIRVFFVGLFLLVMCTPFIKMYKTISDYVIYACLIILSNMLLNITCSFVKTMDKNKLYAISGIVNSILLGAFNILFLLVFKMTISGYLLSIFLAQMLTIIFLIIFGVDIKKLIKSQYNTELTKKMIIFSLPLVLNNISWWVLNSSDKIMIERMLDSTSLGIYSAAAKIPAFISIINTIFLQSWTISIIKDYEDEENHNNVFFSNIYEIYSFIITFASIVLLTVLKPLIEIYIGSAFQECLPLAPLLINGTIFFGYSLFFGAIYSAVGKNKAVGWSTLIAAIINISINYLLISKCGIIVASISTFISYLFVAIYRMIDSRKYIKFKINIRAFIINNILLFTETMIITFQYKTYLCSLSILMMFMIINKNTIYKMYTNIKKYLLKSKGEKKL